MDFFSTFKNIKTKQKKNPSQRIHTKDMRNIRELMLTWRRNFLKKTEKGAEKNNENNLIMFHCYCMLSHETYYSRHILRILTYGDIHIEVYLSFSILYSIYICFNCESFHAMHTYGIVSAKCDLAWIAMQSYTLYSMKMPSRMDNNNNNNNNQSQNGGFFFRCGSVCWHRWVTVNDA